MKLSDVHNSDVNTINVIGMQIKRKLERLGIRQVELTRASRTNSEATVVADIGDHVILRSDLLIRITSPDEFIVQIPTAIANSIGIKDSTVVHGIDQVGAIIARIAGA